MNAMRGGATTSAVPTPSALAARPRTEQERRAALGLPELKGPEFAPSTPPPVDPGRTTSEGDY